MGRGAFAFSGGERPDRIGAGNQGVHRAANDEFGGPEVDELER